MSNWNFRWDPKSILRPLPERCVWRSPCLIRLLPLQGKKRPSISMSGWVGARFGQSFFQGSISWHARKKEASPEQHLTNTVSILSGLASTFSLCLFVWIWLRRMQNARRCDSSCRDVWEKKCEGIIYMTSAHSSGERCTPQATCKINKRIACKTKWKCRPWNCRRLV